MGEPARKDGKMEDCQRTTGKSQRMMVKMRKLEVGKNALRGSQDEVRGLPEENRVEQEDDESCDDESCYSGGLSSIDDISSDNEQNENKETAQQQEAISLKELLSKASDEFAIEKVHIPSEDEDESDDDLGGGKYMVEEFCFEEVFYGYDICFENELKELHGAVFRMSQLSPVIKKEVLDEGKSRVRALMSNLETMWKRLDLKRQRCENKNNVRATNQYPGTSTEFNEKTMRKRKSEGDLSVKELTKTISQLTMGTGQTNVGEHEEKYCSNCGEEIHFVRNGPKHRRGNPQKGCFKCDSVRSCPEPKQSRKDTQEVREEGLQYELETQGVEGENEYLQCNLDNQEPSNEEEDYPEDESGRHKEQINKIQLHVVRRDAPERKSGEDLIGAEYEPMGDAQGTLGEGISSVIQPVNKDRLWSWEKIQSKYNEIMEDLGNNDNGGPGQVKATEDGYPKDLKGQIGPEEVCKMGNQYRTRSPIADEGRRLGNEDIKDDDPMWISNFNL